MSKTKDQILDQALKAYHKLGNVMMYSKSNCDVGTKYVYIRNGATTLAKYDYKNKVFIPSFYNHRKMEWQFEK